MYNGSTNGGSGRRIPPLYIYIGIGVLVLLGIWLVVSLLRPGIDGYYALGAGVLLLIGNLRDILMPSNERSNVGLFNALVGGGLISFWLAKGGFPPLGGLWYIPAVLALVLAAPLMLGRAAVYSAYVNTARSLVDNARRAVGSVMSRTY
jgi:hypothetical protein